MKLTLIGLNSYYESLWEELDLPEGIDATDVKNEILLRGGEFEVLYANAEFIKKQIGHISRKWNRTFTKWKAALDVEYEPLSNYDRTEIWTDTGNTTNHSTGTSTDSTTGGGNNSVINKRSAFNSETMKDNDTSTSTLSNTTSGNTSLTNDSNVSTNNSRSGHTFGNIGVTTSQQMLEAELDISLWNLVEHIADIFIQELTIPVYI